MIWDWTYYNRSSGKQGVRQAALQHFLRRAYRPDRCTPARYTMFSSANTSSVPWEPVTKASRRCEANILTGKMPVPFREPLFDGPLRGRVRVQDTLGGVKEEKVVRPTMSGGSTASTMAGQPSALGRKNNLSYVS